MASSLECLKVPLLGFQTATKKEIPRETCSVHSMESCLGIQMESMLESCLVNPMAATTAKCWDLSLAPHWGCLRERYSLLAKEPLTATRLVFWKARTMVHRWAQLLAEQRGNHFVTR